MADVGVAMGGDGGVPGPPRGRRRTIGGTVLERIERRRRAELAGTLRTRVARMLSLSADVILLLKDLAADPRVSRRHRAAAGLAIAYLATPVDLVPDAIPVLGQLDDLLVVGWAVRSLLAAAGYGLIYELWRGSDEGLATVLALAGVQR